MCQKTATEQQQQQQTATEQQTNTNVQDLQQQNIPVQAGPAHTQQHRDPNLIIPRALQADQQPAQEQNQQQDQQQQDQQQNLEQNQDQEQQQQDQDQQQDQEQDEQQFEDVRWSQQLRRTSGQIDIQRARQAALGTATSLLSEFNVGQKAIDKSKSKREKAFEKKKKLYDGQAAQAWRNDRANQTRRDPDAEEEEAAQPVLNDGHVADIKTMLHPNMDYLAYNDDEAFQRYFSANYAQIEKFCALKEVLDNTDDAALKEKDKDLPSLAALQKKVDEYIRIREFYRAKMDIISSPFYMVLRADDTKNLTIDELERKRNKCREDRRGDLADYLDALVRLKKLEASNLTHKKKRAILRGQTGGGMKTNEGAYFALGSLDVNRSKGVSINGKMFKFTSDEDRGYKELWHSKTEEDTTTDSTETQEESFLDKVHDWKQEEKKKVKEKEEKIKEKLKADNDLEWDSTILGDLSIKAGVSASETFKFAEAGAYKKSKSGVCFSKASVSFLEETASGNIGANLGYDWKHDQYTSFHGDVGVSGEVKVTVIKSEAAAGILKDTKYGTMGADVGGKIEIGVAEATACGKLGKFTMKIGSETKEVVGIGGVLGAKAAVASATGHTSFTVCGIKFNVKATADALGIGGTLGGYAGIGGVGVSVGALLGFGAQVDLDIDFSYWTDKAIAAGGKFFRKKWREWRGSGKTPPEDNDPPADGPPQ